MNNLRRSLLFASASVPLCFGMFSVRDGSTTADYSSSAVTRINGSAILNLQQTERFKLSIKTSQLPPRNRVIPIEMKCEHAELSAPNTLEKLSCKIKNNTDKAITAGAFYTSISIEKDGTTILSSSYGTFDTFLHSDFREEHKSNLILPGSEYPHDLLPVSFENNTVISGIVVGIDYIEFEDHTSLGPNRAGSQILADTREGAEKYRNWLIKKYDQSGRSVDAILPFVDSDEGLPKDLHFQTGPEESGARMYRNFARRTYKVKGREGLVRHLKRGKISHN